MKTFVLIIPLVILLCFTFSCQDKEAMAELEEFKAQAEVEEQNKALIKRWFEEVDKGNIESIFALVDEVFPDDYISHGADYKLHSPKDLKEHITSSQNSFSDMQHIIEDNFAEGNMVATRCTFRATHKGEFMGIPPTGKQITFPVLYIHRIEDGKIKEAWIDYDSLLSLVMQLGMELSPKVDVTAETEALRARSDGIVGAEAALDVEGSLAFYAEDAIVQPAGAPQIRGHEAIAGMYRQFFEDSQMKEFYAKGSHLTVSQGGDLSYEYGINRTVLAGPEGDLLDIGKYLLVWKKIDDEWFIVALSFTSDAPAPTPVGEQ